MIKVKVLKDKNGKATGLHCAGHALYAEHGNDIVCAGASALITNLVNSVEAFTDDKFELKLHEKKGNLKFILDKNSSDKSLLLLESCILGIKFIAAEYGDKYIQIITEEVK